MVTFPHSPEVEGAPPQPFSTGGWNAPARGVPAAASAGDAYRPSFFGLSASPFPNGAALPSTAIGSPAFFSILSTIFNSAQSWINNLASSLLSQFAPPASTPPATAPTPPGLTLQNGTLQSVGDPHLSVIGTDVYGNAVDSHVDSMVSHADLLDTQDFGDDFRVSTQVTAPDANGVTTNASATATMNGGNDAVTLANDGTLSITRNGRSLTLARGASTVLSGGERVTRGTDGSVAIAENNGAGETMTTTFRANGSGVDVSATVNGGVTVGGDLVAPTLTSAAARRTV